MLQIKCFKLPEQEAEANEFLANIKLDGNVAVGEGLMTVSYEDGRITDAHELQMLYEMRGANRTNTVQTRATMYMLERELAEIGPAPSLASEKTKKVELETGVQGCKKQLENFANKDEWIENCIAALHGNVS